MNIVYETYHYCYECEAFAVYCLLGCSSYSNHVGDHTGILHKVILALFEDFACVSCCRNDKDMTSYEGYQKTRRYFNQIYWEKLPSKLIITSAK